MRNFGTFPHDRMESWKEIAAFIGRDVRTAMRWEEGGMPVHRIVGIKRSRVYALRSEISQWMFEHPDSERDTAETVSDVGPFPQRVHDDAKADISHRTQSRKYWIAGALVLSVALIAVAAVTVKNSFQPPMVVRVGFTENAVQAFDAQGQKLWTRSFPRPFIPHFGAGTGRDMAYFARVVDFRGDNEPNVVILAPFWSERPGDVPVMEVDCFSSRGDLLWSYSPHERFQFGDNVLTGSWSVVDLLVSRNGPRRRIWVSVSDQTWGNSYVAELDPATGNATVRFANTGALYMVSEFKTPRAAFLLAAGFNNEYASGTLAALDEAKPFAASPQSEGTRHKCVSCPKGDPDYYFVYPRSEINTVSRETINALRSVEVREGQLQISKSELQRLPAMRTIYSFSLGPPTGPQSIVYSTDYDIEHAELEHKGEIKHSLKECPERLHPKPVRMWTPASGWTELPVRAL